MTYHFDLSKVERQPVEQLLAGLKSKSEHESKEAGLKLLARARDANLNLRDYLTLSVDVRQGDSKELYSNAKMNGFEASMHFLGLPFADDLENGVLLQAASDTFNTFPGTRAMFPEVIDETLRFAVRQEMIENAAAIVGQSRTISQTEMISTVVDDDSAELGTFTVPELARVPVRTIRTSETSVKMFKHGSAYRTSYEFNRRARLDIMTPFAARVARQLEISKVAAATSVLINGDGINGAATAETLGSYGADFTGTLSLKDNYRALAKFLMKRAKAGNPVDTIVGNFDTYVELMFMFLQTKDMGGSDVQQIASMGGPSMQLPIMGGAVRFAFSSAVPDDRLICFSRAETLEELVESGAQISENERSILNQSITYVRTEVTGYKLAFGDTRTILNTAA